MIMTQNLFFCNLKKFSSQGLLNRAQVNYTCCYLTAWLFTLATKKNVFQLGREIRRRGFQVKRKFAV